jgi:hypothetical protein
MIIVIAGKFEIFDRGVGTGRYEFQASHGIDYATGNSVVLPGDHPQSLGAVMHEQLKEWVLYDSDKDREKHEYLYSN